MKQSASGKNKRVNPAVLLFAVYACSGPRGVPLEEVRELGSNRSNLRMLRYLPESRRRAGGEGHKIGQQSSATLCFFYGGWIIGYKSIAVSQIRPAGHYGDRVARMTPPCISH
jgi:hypothetical protein